MAPFVSPLKRYLDKHGLTQRQFARISGLAESQIHEYCTWTPGGEGRRPGIDAAIDIERASGGELPVRVWYRRRLRAMAA